MQSLSYSLTPVLKENLQTIELLRTQILLAPLSPKNELKLRYESMIGKIFWSMNMSQSSLTKSDVETIITSNFPISNKRGTRHSPQEKDVLSYKKALDYIFQNWQVTKNQFRIKDLLFLADLVQTKQLNNNSESLSDLLNYLHESSSSPIIQAATAQMIIICYRPFRDGNGRLSRLLALVYLYKAGYDFRGMLLLEEFWRRDVSSLEIIKDTVLKTNSLNSWLEYFTQGAITQLTKSLEKIKLHSFQSSEHGFWDINDRQKQIISYLSFPQATITNRKLQKHFKISQITASRDLARLTTLGLLTPHGKGRSIYYTRV